ncbi:MULTISPECIES: DUF4926 domain-containing protein [Pectobacterium]|uniref:DUF4926 domain-containing protein n=1 Tax=Pectobacterium parvum TaxID=2778550 RepID=A0AAP9IJ25_9GAMM|nr:MULTISPECIES: DUF4926 domain-containing protein [Pectobacterium]AIK13493.1 hypothetical protein GZ59_16650 [Pectobacterium atrosepticum]MBN3239863.1 DUF4926 domain-containing protein [Pectobacterium versatile]QHQ26300.1 DUF4926 domain-containing protein [Pectobacterium parvum]UUE37866.1 DUF4926 domain-containing protein [Pectobacterium aroidearum]UUE42241.1 DUF4926 domain-containing protein [Pectobacterium aroidearum]
MASYSLFDVISLKNDLPDEGFKKGMLGPIVHIYNVPSPAYEIEFCDDNGETLACITLTPDCISKVDFKK